MAKGVPPGRRQVTGVNKAINEFGTRFVNQIGGPLADGTPWWLNRTTAVGLLQNGANTFFVAAADGSVSEVRVSDALNVGHDYLTTTPRRQHGKQSDVPAGGGDLQDRSQLGCVAKRGRATMSAAAFF